VLNHITKTFQLVLKIVIFYTALSRIVWNCLDTPGYPIIPDIASLHDGAAVLIFFKDIV